MMFLFLVFISFFWVVIVFLDTMFKSCMVYPYILFLNSSGLVIKPLAIFWRITRFNDFLDQIGKSRKVHQFLRHWFNVGASITCLIIIPCFILYIFVILHMFSSSTIEEFEKTQLTPVLPGINLPLSQWKLYVFVVLICSIFHEMGHAFAASREGVDVYHIGFNLYFIFPVTYVHIRDDQFQTLNKWQQMRILCAGIWHNIVLSIGALLLLLCFAPISSPLFYTGKGVSVLSIHKQSSLKNPGGFVIGDEIFKVGNCSVKNPETWISCLNGFKEKSCGLCVPESLLDVSNSLTFDQCAYTKGHLYFQKKSQRKASELFRLTEAVGTCLHARTAADNFNLCTKTPDCKSSSHCMFPYLPDGHQFVVIKIYGKPAVLYAGSIDELIGDVQVSEYLPRFKIFSSSFAESVKEFLQFTLMCNSGIVCLNVLPLSSLDGDHIIENLIFLLLSRYVSYPRRKWIVKYIRKSSYGIAAAFVFAMVFKLYEFYF